MYHNGNWCGLVEDDTFSNQITMKEKSGPCWYAFIDNIVDVDGNIYLCGACDVERKTKIGNLFEQSLDEIYDINGVYSKIINDQYENVYNGCCKECTEHYDCPIDCLDEYSKKWKWLRDVRQQRNKLTDNKSVST